MHNNVEKYIVQVELQGTRLDKCITILDNEMSRMAVGRLLDEGNITVNRKDRKSIIQGTRRRHSYNKKA